jgi:hypothetical protein
VVRKLDLKLKEISEDAWLTQIEYYVPSAWIGHAPFMRFLIRELKPNIFVELGTHHGFSYFVACQAVKELNLSTKTFAVDHWKGDPHAGEFDDSVYLSVLETNKKYSDFSSLLKMSFLSARSEIEDGSVDLLHIDGFHTYEAVKEDFETWIPKVAKNGIVLLHDIHVRYSNFGVHLFWEELKEKYQTVEFVGSYGLGVVFLGESNESSIANIRNYGAINQFAKVQGVFGCLSETVLHNYREFESLSLKSELTSLKSDLEQLKSDFSNCYLQIDSLLHSRSWQVTAPLRMLLRFIHKVI